MRKWKHNWRRYMDYDIYALQHELSNILTEKRLFHSFGVQSFSFALALRYGYDTSKANVAGLLHDCAKCMKDTTILMECEKNNIAVRAVERRSPYLLHGKLGAYYAEYKYGITDRDVLSAITYHTTGKPDMNMLEKIVFTADYIEPNRSTKCIPGLEYTRELAFCDLDKAVYQILDNTLQYLESKQLEIDNLTIDAYDYYKSYRK